MTIAIARAYNGKHKKYKQELEKLDKRTFLFNIDNADWLKNFQKKKKGAFGNSPIWYRCFDFQ